MNSILLVLASLDSKVFFDEEEKYREFLNIVDRQRDKRNLDLSLLCFYSNEEYYVSRKIVEKINQKRDAYPKLVLGRSFTRNDGNLTSFNYVKHDKNKEYVYSYMMKYLSKFIDVGEIMIFDDNLKLPPEELKKIFGERKYSINTNIEIPKKKKYLFKTI